MIMLKDYVQKKRQEIGMQYQTLYVSIKEEPSDKA